MDDEPVSATAETPADDILDGAKAFADFTGFPLRRVFHLLETGQLPAGKLGHRWTGSKRAVRNRLSEVTNGEAA